MRKLAILLFLFCSGTTSCREARAGYSKVNCASVYLADNASATDVIVQNTWYTIAGTWGQNSLNTWTRSNGVLTSPAVGGGGEYFMSWTASATATAEDIFELAVFINGTRLEPPSKVEISKNGVATVSGSGCITILDNKQVELKIRNVSNTSDATVTHAAVAIHRI